MAISLPQWELVEYDQIKMMLNLPVDQVQLQFEDIPDFKNHQTCLKEAALLDYFVNGFWWAKEMKFTCRQISFVMALLQQSLDNIKNRQLSFTDNFKAFTQTVLATRLSPSTEADTSHLFDADQIRAIADYFKTSLFQHYRLYEILFTHPREEQLLGMEKSVEVINPVDYATPLEEGMPADLYFHYVAPSCVETPEQGSLESHEENGEEPGKTEMEESDENHADFSVKDVREVLGEITQDMLAKLQADFTEKLRVHEETYISRLERLQKVSDK
ncbi:ciliary-associated calcium-binding coiled-coil protein 1 [Myxocyprinus asiaticus]|uniref:ciliary-associated calcium-binding coiled-coil protein 1 n=1 Tax=Myxocyprinus asiaticus TaxID=70543 RepID=UPI0022216D24|nr:ciliary-associated calcium-binding coiled-coil protein 1 [Myxocyprinus asiaticus]